MTIDNFKVDTFQLISGAPIHISELDLFIYQPRLYQIAEIGEERFYNYLSYFRIKKSLILQNISDPMQLESLNNMTEYEVLKALIDDEPDIEVGMSIIFKLIIKDLRSIKFNIGFIFINTEAGQQYIINNDSFLVIKDIVYQIFGLEDTKKEFNPTNKAAEEIVNKISDRRKKLSEMQGKKDQSILTDFVSILAVGLNCVNMKDILNLTIYQIFNIMKRFGMYSQYNIQIQALMQGAEDVELIDWLQKI